MGKRPGSTWACFILLAAAALHHAPAQAQNLGLGTGSRSPTPQDSAAQAPAVQSQGRGGSDRQEDSAPRKSTMNKRLGLLGRKGGPFDPKVYEARGRELTGQFYEIAGGPGNAAKWPTTVTGIYAAKQKSDQRQWMIWAGAAGLAGASAAVVGYLLMDNAHPTQPPPKVVNLSDEP